MPPKKKKKRTFPPQPPTLSDTAYENVCKCRYTSDREKISYLAALATCGIDATLAEKTHENLRRGKLRKGGKPALLFPTEGLGVLMSEVSFLGRTASAFRLSPLKFEKSYRKWIEYEMKRAQGEAPTQSEIDVAFMFRKARVPARQDGEIWLFRNPQRKTEAFDGVLDKWLGARLGLDLQPGELRLTFGFAAAHVDNPTEPRFFDATWKDFLSKWHWGGKTLPLSGTPKSHGGLEEVVADPPLLRDLNRPVLAMSFRVP